MKFLKYFLFGVFLLLTISTLGNGTLISFTAFTILTILFFPGVNEKLRERGIIMSSKSARYIYYCLLFFVGLYFTNPNKDSKSTVLKPDEKITIIKDEKPTKNNNEKSIDNFELGPVHKTSNTSEINQKNSDVIVGLDPSDIIANFEKLGFETERSLNQEFSMISQTSTDNGIEYNVTTYFENGGVIDVTAIEFHATRIDPSNNSVEDMKKFLKFGCTINYNGANFERAKSFIEKNYYNDGASTVISNVRFTIYCKTSRVRYLKIDKS